MKSSHSYFLAMFVFGAVDCLTQMTVFQNQCFIICKISKKTSGDLLGEGLGVTDQCPKELVSLREYFLRISRLILMIIRNIFVFTLALSDLLLTASVPFTVLDALTQVQVFMLNKCSTMFAKYVDLSITSQSVRKVPKYSFRHSSFASFFIPQAWPLPYSLFACRSF